MVKFDEAVNQIREKLQIMKRGYKFNDPSAFDVFDFTWRIETERDGTLRVIMNGSVK